jgi:hypothetical protein
VQDLSFFGVKQGKHEPRNITIGISLCLHQFVGKGCSPDGEAAPVRFVALPLNKPLALQFAEQLAERGGTNIEHFQQFSLTDWTLVMDNGQHPPLRMMRLGRTSAAPTASVPGARMIGPSHES